jgi:hypothetical protein
MLITVTSTLQLDTSYDYISNNEAIQYFIQHFIEKEIFIDTLALKTEKQGITRTFSLSSFSGETKEIRF